MKWVVVASFIVCLATLSKGSALRSTPQSKDAASSKYSARREANKLPRGLECLPGSRWKSKCNGCTCSEDGHPVCTDMACPGQEDEPELTCAPDTAWKIECNTCTCSPEGRAMCTRMGCGLFSVTDFDPVGDENEEDKSELGSDNDSDYYFDDHNLVKRSSVCKPNALLKADCNFCQCASDGQSYSCTINECIEPDVSGDVEVFKQIEDDDEEEASTKVCKPRGTLYIGCNTCRCNIDGTNFTCTNKPCPLPDDVELFHELREMKPIVP